MAMAIDHSSFHMDFSSSTTTSTGNDSTWNNWTPVVDWETLSIQLNEFNHLIQSMFETTDDDASYSPLFVHSDQENSISNSHTHHLDYDHNQIIEMEEEESEDKKGLRLIHLLMAAAEALSGANNSPQLARVILVRLNQIVSPNQGSNMERLATHFTQALQSLLQPSNAPQNTPRGDILPAFQLLQHVSPYVSFGHFTANQAILESVSNHRRIHIVDYDIMEGIQWPSFMQSLLSSQDATPPPHLRITALTRGGTTGKTTLSTVQETGRRLTAFAASIGQPFSFHMCRLDSDESFRPNSLKLVRGEALVFNCMLNLPHFSFRPNASVRSFLSGAKSVRPRLITLVEEEVGPIGNGGFIERFMDTLHHYSSIYDSLEAGFPKKSEARELVERVFIGPRIIGSVDRIYRARADVECASWSGWMRSVGFRGVDVSYANHCQAKLLLGLFSDGYKVEEMGGNRLVIGWKSRRILSASVWTSPLDIESTVN